MEPLSRFRRLLVYLGLYTLGLALLIVSLSVPFWETMASDHQGLWASCRNGSCYAWSDERLLQVANVSHDLPTLSYAVTQTLASSSLVLAVLALASYSSWITQHKDHRLMLITCILTLCSGVTDVASVAVFGAWRETDSAHLGWGYWVAVASSVILFLVSLALTLDRGIMTRLEHQRVPGPDFRHLPEAKNNPAFSRDSGLSTVAGVPNLTYHRASANYLLPDGLQHGARTASLGSMEGDDHQPWAAGAGRLF